MQALEQTSDISEIFYSDLSLTKIMTAGLNAKPIVDIYPYYGVWMVHHQVDWAIAKYLETNKLADVSFYL